MSSLQIMGILLGAIAAAVGLVYTIISILNYGFDHMITIAFTVLFIVGLLIIGIVWSQ